MTIIYQAVKSIGASKVRARHFDGFKIGEVHQLDVVDILFHGGHRLVATGSVNPDGSARCLEYSNISVGDRFRLMVLPAGLVVDLRPEGLAHLPPGLLESYIPGRN